MGESDINKVFDRLETIEENQKEHATKFFRRLDEQDVSITTIKAALIGNAEFKQPGLVDRVEVLESGHEDQETKIADNAKAVAKWAGAVAVISIAIAIAKFIG